MTTGPEFDGNKARTALTSNEAAASTFAVGLAAFELDYAADRILWSENAHAVLGLRAFELPQSQRALTRLLTPQSQPRRLPATPPAQLAADRNGPDYTVRYELMPRGGRAYGVEVEEQGRWTGEDGGPATGCIGVIRAIDRQLDATSVGLYAQPRNHGAGHLLARDELLAVLEGTAANLAREQLHRAVFMLIAVDDIGRINANFGYETGDRAIAAVAERILERMRQGDVLGHMSGHKFGAILFNCDEAALPVAAARFRSVVRDAPVEIGGAVIRCDVVIGAVMLPRHALNVSMAVIRAEEALADARADAERRLRLYLPSPMRDAERRRNVEIADEIQRGLEDGRFVLAYQPVVDATTRRLLSYEALCRLVLPNGRVVSAAPYIGVAERLGLVRRLDLRALAMVLADLAACPDLRLSVNASAESLLDPSWLGMLLEAPRAGRDTLGRLTVEITETAAIACVDDLLHLAATLRELGCRIAIDDFGSGHSSFRVLRELRPDWLKIDGAFIRNLLSDPDALVFVETLTRLASHFHIRTVAEFVQDESSARLLAEMGIAALQGRHVGEPLLRLGPMSDLVLGRELAETREDDGYPSFAGLLSGTIAVDAP